MFLQILTYENVLYISEKYMYFTVFYNGFERKERLW